jgi:exosortase H (IPTLxxWG-CTERM-specific)
MSDPHVQPDETERPAPAADAPPPPTGGPPAAAAPPEAGRPASRRDAIRFIIGFVVLFGGLYALFAWAGPVRTWFVDPWTESVATSARVVLGLLGEPVLQSGRSIYTRGYGLDIIDGCNGITPLTLLLAGVLAFPTTWRARAWGLLIGVPAVLFVNLLRIVALWYLGRYHPDWFDRSHLYVAQAFVILVTGGVWLWWLGRFAAPVPRAAGSRAADSGSDPRGARPPGPA